MSVSHIKAMKFAERYGTVTEEMMEAAQIGKCVIGIQESASKSHGIPRVWGARDYERLYEKAKTVEAFARTIVEHAERKLREKAALKR